MLSRYFYKIQLLLCFIFFAEVVSKNKYDTMLKWALEKGLEISPKLAMNYTDENNKNYYLKEDVKVNETLLKIPIDLTLSSPKIKDLFKKFKKNSQINELYEKINPEAIDLTKEKDFRQEECFIAGVFYLINHFPKKYKNSKLVKKYSAYMDNFETNLEHFPYYYTKEQRALFAVTSFGGLFDIAEKMYTEDAEKLVKVLGHEIDMDEFAKYRAITASKGINVTGHYHLIPFIDMFYKSPSNSNLNLTYNETTQIIEIYATKDIKEEDKLYFIAPYVPNINSLLLFGTTYDETINYVQQFSMPMILGSFLDSKGYNKEKANLNAKVDLTDNKFYEKVMDVYKNFLKKMNQESNEMTALNLFLENLQFLRSTYNSANQSVIYRTFIGKKSIENAIRLMKSEINFVENRIEAVKKVIEIFREELKKKEKEEKEKNEKKDDL